MISRNSNAKAAIVMLREVGEEEVIHILERHAWS